MNRRRVNLVRKALEYHAPLSDAQLAWLMKYFGMSGNAVRSIRYKLTRRGEVRFARKTYVTGRGQAVCQWELTPPALRRETAEARRRKA